MATVNQQSMRDEVDRLQSEFDRLSRNKKLSPEVKLLVVGLMTLVKSKRRTNYVLSPAVNF